MNVLKFHPNPTPDIFYQCHAVQWHPTMVACRPTNQSETNVGNQKTIVQFKCVVVGRIPVSNSTRNRNLQMLYFLYPNYCNNKTLKKNLGLATSALGLGLRHRGHQHRLIGVRLNLNHLLLLRRERREQELTKLGLVWVRCWKGGITYDCCSDWTCSSNHTT